MEATNEKVLAGACTLADLLTSGTRDEGGSGGAGAERALLVDGASWTCPGVTLDVATEAPELFFRVDVATPKLLLGLCCRPCNSFSANIASWNNLLTELYSL